MIQLQSNALAVCDNCQDVTEIQLQWVDGEICLDPQHLDLVGWDYIPTTEGYDLFCSSCKNIQNNDNTSIEDVII